MERCLPLPPQGHALPVSAIGKSLLNGPRSDLWLEFSKKLLPEEGYVYSRQNQSSRVPQARRDRRSAFTFTILLQSRIELAGVSRPCAGRGARPRQSTA